MYEYAMWTLALILGCYLPDRRSRWGETVPKLCARHSIFHTRDLKQVAINGKKQTIYGKR